MKLKSIRLATVSASILLSLTGGLLSAAPSMAAPASVPVKTNVSVPMQTYSDPFTKKVHDLMNAERAKVGARPLVYNQKIADVSQDWAGKLGVKLENGTFDWAQVHRPDAGGSLIPSGYTMYRENVGFNFTPEQIVQWWMDSAGHKAAMLHSGATDAGLGYVIPRTGPYAGWHIVVSNLAGYPTTQVPTTPAPDVVVAGTQYKTTLQLNLRSGGGLEYPVIGYGVTGTVVTATGRTNGIWYEVKMGTQTGWMSSEYLVKYADASTISYSGHVENIGWQSTVSNGATAGSVGLGARLEALRFTSAGQTARAHVQNIGWQEYRSGASTIGTDGQALRMEAIQVKSTVAGQTIRCQAHVEGIGWMTEVGDGQLCGTEGRSLRLEAVRLRIVK